MKNFLASILFKSCLFQLFLSSSFDTRCLFGGREDSFDCRAVLRVHHQDYDAAHQLIEVTRDMLDTELTALSSESYQRAYPIMVQVCQNLDLFTP
jgi:hypothetical protein